MTVKETPIVLEYIGLERIELAQNKRVCKIEHKVVRAVLVRSANITGLRVISRALD